MNAPSPPGDAAEVFVAALERTAVHHAAFGSLAAQAAGWGRRPLATSASLLQGLSLAHDPDAGGAVPERLLQDLRRPLALLVPGEPREDRGWRRWLLRWRPAEGRAASEAGGRAWLERCERAVPGLHAQVSRLYEARDGLQREAVRAQAARARLEPALAALAAESASGEVLLRRLAALAAAADGTDPVRAQALREALLRPLEQALRDLQAQQRVGVQARDGLALVEHNGRAAAAACERVAAQVLQVLAAVREAARAAGTPVRALEAMAALAALGSALQEARAPHEGSPHGRLLRERVDQVLEALDQLQREQARHAAGQSTPSTSAATRSPDSSAPSM